MKDLQENITRSSTEYLFRFFSQAPAAIAVLSGPDHVYTLANPLYLKLFNKSSEELIGKSLKDVSPELTNQGVYDIFNQVYSSRQPFVSNEFQITFLDNGQSKIGYYNFVIQPIIDEADEVNDLMVHVYEVTNQVMALQKVKESEEKFKVLANAMPQLVWIAEPNGTVTYYNERVNGFAGSTQLPNGTWQWEGMVHPDDTEATVMAWKAAISTGETYEMAHRIKMKDGSYRWHLSRSIPQLDNGKIVTWYGTATDIHEQKVAEEQLAKLVAIVEASHDFIALASIDHKILYVNPAGLNIVGWNSTQEQTILDCIYEEDREIALNSYIPELFTKGSFSHEIRFYNEKTDKPVWMQWNGLTIQDPLTKKITALATVSQDISKRKEIELALKESENRFRNIANSAPVMIWTSSGTEEVTFWNKTWLDYTGQSEQQSLGQGWRKVMHPEDEPHIAELYSFSFARRLPFTTEIRIKGKDGIYRWFLVNATPSFDLNKKFTGYTGTVTEIQHIKDAEVAIRESEERFRIIADATPTMIWGLTPDGKQRYLNRYGLEYLGMTVSEITDMDWKEVIHPDDYGRAQKELGDAIAERKIYSIEHRVKRHDGEYRWFLSQGAPSYFTTGELAGYVGTGTDIHDWKLAQEELKKNEENLENLVRIRTNQLRRSNEDLQQFAHVASHDLKEPLRKIKTFAFRLQDEVQELTPQSKTFVSKILSAADRLTKMVEGVLTFSQVDSIKSIIEEVDLNEIIEQIQSDLEIVLQQKNAAIHKDRLPSIEGAKMLLYQLFYNLINNSLKFSKQNHPPVIEIKSNIIAINKKQYAQIIISDNGIGFESEFDEKIFETFLRLHSKDKYEGTGLGLALCRKIVTRHGGVISAKGRKNEGATFYVQLPFKQVTLPE